MARSVTFSDNKIRYADRPLKILHFVLCAKTKFVDIDFKIDGNAKYIAHKLVLLQIIYLQQRKILHYCKNISLQKTIFAEE